MQQNTLEGLHIDCSLRACLGEVTEINIQLNYVFTKGYLAVEQHTQHIAL